MTSGQLSIRNLLLLTVGSLTLLIALLAGQEVYTQWRKLQSITLLKDAMAVSDELFDATRSLSVERDVAFIMLHAPDTQSVEQLQPRLDESRHKADASLSVAAQSLKQYSFPELVSLREDMEKHLSTIQALRQQVDKEIRLPPGERDPALSGLWYDEITELMTRTDDVWTKFIKHFTAIDPIATQHLRYRHFLRIINDYAGRERSLIGRLIIENADATPQDTAQLLRWQGMIDLSWKTSQLLVDQSGLGNEVGPYFKDAQSQYQTVYDMVKDIFFIPGARHGATYPIDVNLWFELASQSADSFEALREASEKATRHYVETIEAESRSTILEHLAVLAFALILCAYCFGVIIRRVIQPINAMVQALLDASAGKPVTLAPYISKRNDEIGKLAEVLHAFRVSGERYRALVEASAQIIWTWRPGETGEMGALYEWWEKTTGQPGSEMLPFGWVKMVHPEDREQAQTIWANASSKGENFEMEYRAQRREGGWCWVYVRGVALKNPDGGVQEFVGALTDISERKEAEAELLNYTLALERSNKELDDFAYIASHDLKEPLRGIHNHSRFLLEDNADKLDQDSTNRLGRLVYLSQRMERLVNDLLYFSRLGRQDMAIQPTDLNEAVHDIQSTLESFLEERKARIEIPIPLPIITCDKPRVTELLRNLITNAVKYNDQAEKVVEIGFLAEHPDAASAIMRQVFYVKDNGRGIAPEFHQEVFRIFKRLQSAKDGEEGTGVGLTFVKKIVERHGGHIWLESTPGVGTTFYFTLKGPQYDSKITA